MANCPCCKQSTQIDLKDLIDDYGLDSVEIDVLRSLWCARGIRVRSALILDAIYAQDINGGPSPEIMYRTLRNAVASLNEKLQAVGVSAVFVSNYYGWKLNIGRAA